jgi:ADP-ribose pyrophosphatase YjhB (NUDIX family)
MESEVRLSIARLFSGGVSSSSNETVACRGENNSLGWWLLGGFVECGNGHADTAIKETLEEAGIDVILKGILRVENQMQTNGARQRVIYFAEPKDPDQAPKSVVDRESVRAAWLSIKDLEEKSSARPPEGLRGPELLDWARYIERGGAIYPLSVFTTERTPVPSEQSETKSEEHIERNNSLHTLSSSTKEEKLRYT